MPIRYNIHPDRGLVVTHFTGRVTHDELVDTYRRIMADADYELGTNELADLREIDGLDITAASLRAVEELTGARYAGSEADFRTAILAPNDAAFGLARMYEVFAEDGPENVRVCRALPQALEWLGLEPEALDL